MRMKVNKQIKAQKKEKKRSWRRRRGEEDNNNNNLISVCLAVSVSFVCLFVSVCICFTFHGAFNWLGSSYSKGGVQGEGSPFLTC